MSEWRWVEKSKGDGENVMALVDRGGIERAWVHQRSIRGPANESGIDSFPYGEPVTIKRSFAARTWFPTAVVVLAVAADIIVKVAH